MSALSSMADGWAGLAWAVTWQLAALGLLAWVGERLLRLRQPRVRHALWWFALVAPLLLAPGRLALERRQTIVSVPVPAPVVDALPQWSRAPTIEPSAMPVIAPEAGIGDADANVGTTRRVAPTEAASAAVAFAVRAVNVVALAWLVGCGVLALRLVNGHRRLRDMLAASRTVQDAATTETLRTLCAAAGVTTPVDLRSSDLVGAPVLCGLNRPVILLPQQWPGSLSEADLRALLAHEVAHIRRRDALANLLQRLIEIPLFFQPFAWLASRRITLAREELCDAWAAEQVSDPTGYARSLAVAAERAYAAAAPASLGVAESKFTLLRRVTAILDLSRARRLSRPLAVALVAGLALSAAALAAVRVTASDLQGSRPNAEKGIRQPENAEMNDMASQCRPLAEQYTQAWAEQRYDLMYGSLDRQSQSLLTVPQLAEWAKRRADSRGTPMRLLELSNPVLSIQFVLAVEIPKGEAERQGLEWPAADRERGNGPRGYVGPGFLYLVQEDSQWLIGAENLRRLSDSIQASPVGQVGFWERQGYAERIGSELNAELPSVPRELTETPTPPEKVGARYLGAWMRGDYRSMYGLLAKETKALESLEAFEGKEREAASSMKPLFVLTSQDPELVMMRAVFECRRDDKAIAEPAREAAPLRQSKEWLCFVKEGDQWRIQHEVAMSRWMGSVLAQHKAGGEPRDAYAVPPELARLWARVDALQKERKELAWRRWQALSVVEQARIILRYQNQQLPAPAVMANVTEEQARKLLAWYEQRGAAGERALHDFARYLIKPDEDRAVEERRQAIVRDIADLGREAAPGLTAEILAVGPHAREAQGALGQMGATATPALLEALKAAREWRQRTPLLDALGATGDPRARDVLLRTLDDPDTWVRRAALARLRKLGGVSQSVYLRCLEDADYFVRRAAIEGLGEVGGATAVPALTVVARYDVELSKVGELWLRRFAREALTQIAARSGKRITLPPKQPSAAVWRGPGWTLPFDDLAAAARCSNRGIRQRAAMLLGVWFPEPRTVRLLRGIARRDPDPRVREEAAKAAKQIQRSLRSR